MNPSRSFRRPTMTLLAAVITAAALAGCSDDGAGSQGNTGNLGPTSPTPGPGGGTAVLSVTVSGAIPASGNALVTGTTPGTSSLVSGTLRLAVADGSGGGLQHRFTVNYDSVTGIVTAVLHSWGASIAAAEAAVGCVRTLGTTTPVTLPSLCGGTVSVDVATSRVTFSNTVLRNGTFTSILNGQVPFTVL